MGLLSWLFTPFAKPVDEPAPTPRKRGRPKGFVCSPETRARMSVAGKHRSAETRAKLSAANRGKPRSAETRAKIGAAHRGKIVSAESRAKMSAARRGKRMSAETRAKISDANRGKRTPAIDAEIARLRASGMPQREIGRVLGLSHGAVQRCLRLAALREAG